MSPSFSISICHSPPTPSVARIWKISTPFSTAAIAFSPICLTIRLRMLRPGQPEERGEQLDDALEVELVGQLDAALGQRPEQPAHQALAEVVEDVVLELEDAALDAGDQVAEEARPEP